jgi:hypothetical protein
MGKWRCCSWVPFSSYLDPSIYHLHNLKIVASITFTGIIFGKLETNIFSLAGEKVNQSCTVATKQVRSLVM